MILASTNVGLGLSSHIHVAILISVKEAVHCNTCN